MSKQEKIVCAAFRFIFSACEEVVLTINYEMNNHAKYLYGLDYLTGFDKGFITNKNRFVDAAEAKKISVYNDNRVDYRIYKEVERLRKEIAKTNNKRNRGDLSVELSLNILMNRYSELEVKLNEFRGRDYLLPEDLY